MAITHNINITTPRKTMYPSKQKYLFHMKIFLQNPDTFIFFLAFFWSNFSLSRSSRAFTQWHGPKLLNCNLQLVLYDSVHVRCSVYLLQNHYSLKYVLVRLLCINNSTHYHNQKGTSNFFLKVVKVLRVKSYFRKMKHSFIQL